MAADACTCFAAGVCDDCLRQFTQCLPEVWSVPEGALLLRPGGCSCPGFKAWSPFREAQLPVIVCLDLKDEGCSPPFAEAVRLSIELVNQCAGREILQYGGCRPGKSRLASAETADRAVCVIVFKGLKGPHGATSMAHCQTSGRVKGSLGAAMCDSTFTRQLLATGKKGRTAKRPLIGMQMRSKPDKGELQQKREYVSTLTHEFFHVLGFAHITDTPKEIMSVGRGGTCICDKCEWPPTSLRSSPRSEAAIRWLYSPSSLALQALVGGAPIHCSVCFGLGWRWT